MEAWIAKPGPQLRKFLPCFRCPTNKVGRLVPITFDVGQSSQILILLLGQNLVHKLNNHGSFAHGRGDTLHALRSDVSPPHCEVRKILELRQSSPSPEP